MITSTWRIKSRYQDPIYIDGLIMAMKKGSQEQALYLVAERLSSAYLFRQLLCFRFGPEQNFLFGCGVR